MNVVADATIPGALATFGYDDEGTAAQRVDIVRDGVWVGVLSGGDSAHLAGLPPGGMVRADGFNRLPMVRMTNVGLLPGDSSLEEIISETRSGVLMSTNRSWSIDDKRLNFQFGCELGWEVTDGKLGRMVRNPTYTGITPRFWGSLDMLAGPEEWRPWGTPNCGKGQPIQIGHTGHPFTGPVPGSAGGGGRMSRLEELAERILGLVRAEAEAEVRVVSNRHGLTRFANSFIHQNVEEETAEAELRVALDGRVSLSATSNLADDALDRFVADAVDAARLQPVDPDWPGVAPPTGDTRDRPLRPETADAASRGASRDGAELHRRREWVPRRRLRRHPGIELCLRQLGGPSGSGRTTRATINGIQQTDTSAGSAHQTSLGIADLDAATAGGIAAERAQRSAAFVDLEPGRYEVVLSPECAATIAVFLAVYGFNAQAHLDGSSFVASTRPSSLHC